MADRLTEPGMAFVPRVIIGEGANFPDLARFYHDHVISRGMQIVERIVARAELVTSDIASGDLVRDLLQTRIDRWRAEQGRQGSTLGYAADPKKAIAPLLDVPGIASWGLFTCPWSMRETEPNVNLLIQPSDHSLDDAPAFQLGGGVTTRPARDTIADEEPVTEEVEA